MYGCVQAGTNLLMVHGSSLWGADFGLGSAALTHGCFQTFSPCWEFRAEDAQLMEKAPPSCTDYALHHSFTPGLSARVGC